MTTKIRLAAEKTVENIRSGGLVKPMGQILKEAGYSDSVSKHPDRVTKTNGWQQLMEKFLPDQRLLQVHSELLENPDWRARDAGLDKAYKIKGKMHSNPAGTGEQGSHELEAVIIRIRTLLPDSIQ